MLTNVVTEFGMTPDQVAVMWMIGTAGEIIARAFFGQLTKIFETTQLYILWSTISTIQMVILCFNRSVHLFWVAIFMNGLAIGGSAGLKMVLIIEMIGIELQVSLNLTDINDELFSESIYCNGAMLNSAISVYFTIDWILYCRLYEPAFDDILFITTWRNCEPLYYLLDAFQRQGYSKSGARKQKFE